MGILDVFFLGNGGHEQVVFNQPCEEVAFFFGVVVVGGKLLCVFDAFFCMIAATAFGDVVQQGGGVEDMWSWICLHNGAGFGHFVAVGFDGETAHIADDGQDVVVYGVNMEEVVLEQAGDFFPCGEIAAKYAVEVEKTESLGKAGAVFEELDEAAAVFWILGKTGVDFRVAAHHARRVCGSMVVMFCSCMVWMMVKMCSGFCSNRARSLAAIWWPIRL